MGDFGSLSVLAVIVFLALIVAVSSIRIINEYERGVVFRLGRLIALKTAGLYFIIPFGVDRLVKMDLQDNHSRSAAAGDHHQRQRHGEGQRGHLLPGRRPPEGGHPGLNYINATSQIAQTTLRAALGQATLDDLLGEPGQDQPEPAEDH